MRPEGERLNRRKNCFLHNCCLTFTAPMIGSPIGTAIPSIVRPNRVNVENVPQTEELIRLLD